MSLRAGQGVQGNKQIPEQWCVGAAIFPILWLQPRPWKACGAAWELSAARVSVELGTLTVLLHWSTAFAGHGQAGGLEGRAGGGSSSDRSNTLPGQS